MRTSGRRPYGDSHRSAMSMIPQAAGGRLPHSIGGNIHKSSTKRGRLRLLSRLFFGFFAVLANSVQQLADAVAGRVCRLEVNLRGLEQLQADRHHPAEG